MKVYLLNPPYIRHFGRAMRWQDTGRAGTLYYPIWLAYATGVLEQECEAKLVDAPAWNWSTQNVINDIKKFQPGLLVMDSSFPSLDNDVSVAEAIKEENHGATIVLVGPPASQFSDEILRSKGVDIVARWEYDLTLREIVRAIDSSKDIKGVKGISYKQNGEIKHNPSREFTNSEDLDRIPFVSKVYQKHLNIRDYFLVYSLYPEVQIFTGRGCPFHCTFCSWTQTLMGRKYRVRSISNVLDEFEWIERHLPQVKEIFIEDDTFTIDRKRVSSFTEEYKRRELNIAWACNARVELDYETMKRIREANCRIVIVGYESGSNEILRNIKKGITVEQIQEFAQNARKAGLMVHGDFIIGLPGETKETLRMTKKLIKEVKPDMLQVSVASPFPGTEFYQWTRERGYLLTSDPNKYLNGQGHQKAVISYSELSNEEMVRVVDEMLKEYYLSPSYVPIALGQVFRKHGWDELRRICRSARCFLGYISRR